MIKNLVLIPLFLICFYPSTLNAQDLLNTSFEDYQTSSINTVNKWSVAKGEATVVENPTYAHSLTKGLKIESLTALQLDHIAYSKTETGLSGDVYVDFWIKINSITTKAVSINGTDLTSGSRNFMLEFSPDYKIKVYNGIGGSATIKPTYTLGTWNRISLKISNASSKYQLAINGSPYSDILDFREIKSGATTFDYHSISFLQASGTCDIALDDIYIGATPIAGITFGETIPEESTTYSITVNQPTNGLISLSPEPTDGKYLNGTKVTASISIADLCQYRLQNWTNDVSGTTSSVTFTMNKNTVVGANIIQNPAVGTTHTVNNYAELKVALETMLPGDIVELSDGEYSGNALTVTRGGCSERPILVRAKNQGMAAIKGTLYFTLKNIEYVTFEGLNFDLEPVPSIFKLEGCNNVRITKNTFRMQNLLEGQSSKWILIGDLWGNLVCVSHHNRIDHNLFDGKYDGGSWLVIDGSHGTSPGDISKYDLIDHNHFRNNTPRASNEKETIRLGVSDLTPSSAYCRVEYNLFENCDGDPEIVSVKSCDNIIKGNTFRSCLGTVCLRQGSRNTVEGNYFFGDAKTVDGNGCGGVRVYGIDHKVVNNYFEGLTGEKWDAACTITNGDMLNSSSSWSAHFIPENIVFAFNTYVNNKSDIEIGFTNGDKYGNAPVNCLITNNIYSNSENPIVKAYSATSLAGVNFANNMMHATGTSSIGITASQSQVKALDPLLIKSDCVSDDNCISRLPYPVYKLSKASPAIDAATVNADYASLDFEGQIRNDAKDIGADEYSNNEIAWGMLAPEYVGPNAIDFELKVVSSIENSSTTPVSIIYVDEKKLYLDFSTESAESIAIKIYDMNGLLTKQTQVNSHAGLNKTTLDLDELPNGVYLLETKTSTYSTTQKFILK